MKAEQARQILDNVPHGATHIDLFNNIEVIVYYKKENGMWTEYDKKTNDWVLTSDGIQGASSMHCLADLLEICQQHDRIQALENQLMTICSRLSEDGVDTTKIHVDLANGLDVLNSDNLTES